MTRNSPRFVRHTGGLFSVTFPGLREHDCELVLTLQGLGSFRNDLLAAATMAKESGEEQVGIILPAPHEAPDHVVAYGPLSVRQIIQLHTLTDPEAKMPSTRFADRPRPRARVERRGARPVFPDDGPKN